MESKQGNPVVLITGCSSGIGLATAWHFHHQGWRVIATLRDPAQHQGLADRPGIICPQLDVTDHARIPEVVAEGLAAFGRLDAVVNNAGYGLMGAFETLSAEQVQRQFATNVFAAMEVCRAVLPHFRAQQRGTIVNITSMVGRLPLPLYSVYNASKHALEGFTEGLTYELEPLGIRVRIVEPGAVNTQFFGRSADRENQTGVQAYAAYSDWQLAVMDRTGPGGSSSEDAARVIYRAATSRSGRLRYLVGSDARMLMFARATLPGRVFRRLIRLSLTEWAMNSVGRLLYRGSGA